MKRQLSLKNGILKDKMVIRVATQDLQTTNKNLKIIRKNASKI